jgi:hypothetical protein
VHYEEAAAGRRPRKEIVEADLAIVGGGLAGTCCAVTAARQGLKVALMQDRPVLGGNASSEVRLWILGATAHMQNNNRWSREGGVVDEILCENLYRNPEGNAVLVDSLLLEKVRDEPNIALMLNTCMYEIEKDGDVVVAARGFCPQNSTLYEMRAPLFCDASGDGVLAFQAGAAFRMGAESAEEFGEGLAPDQAYGELLGHTMYFYSKDVGQPVEYVPPSFALKDITQIPKYRDLRSEHLGCHLWWIEWGGRGDTVHETEAIKWRLWEVVYGIWNYIKNSGEFPQAQNLTLEWVSMIPGKRESRRFEGLYMLRQQDIVQRRKHDDAVSFGGWAIDLHPADGVFSDRKGCNHWHSKGVYQIPYRVMVSRDVPNLFLAGRIISASHVAFGSTRVMATCAHNAQAVAMAAVLCARDGVAPADLLEPRRLAELQRRLASSGQYIPGYRLEDPEDLVREAELEATSELKLLELPCGGTSASVDRDFALLLPAAAGRLPAIEFRLDVAQPTEAVFECRIAERNDHFTPDAVVAQKALALKAGDDQPVHVDFGIDLDQDRYVFLVIRANPHIRVRESERRATGLLSLTYRYGRATEEQRLKEEAATGREVFEAWYPFRRPEGRNPAFRLSQPLCVYGVENVRNGLGRPVSGPNAWAADFADAEPEFVLRWSGPRRIGRIELEFDPDWDHAMESVLWGHPERIVPFCVRDFTLTDGSGNILHERTGNYLGRNTIQFDPPVETDELRLRLRRPNEHVPAALFGIRCYAR